MNNNMEHFQKRIKDDYNDQYIINKPRQNGKTILSNSIYGMRGMAFSHIEDYLNELKRQDRDKIIDDLLDE